MKENEGIKTAKNDIPASRSRCNAGGDDQG
jgi:hypothetical protein